MGVSWGKQGREGTRLKVLGARWLVVGGAKVPGAGSEGVGQIVVRSDLLDWLEV